MGANLDHAQIMGALFLPYFWKHDGWRCNFLPNAQNMVDGIWTEKFYAGGDALRPVPNANGNVDMDMGWR
jgi:hypothetical protein